MNLLTKVTLELVKKSQVVFSKNAPTILTGLGTMGVFSTAALAVKATPAAMADIETAQLYYDHPMTKFEKIKTVWPRYVPAVGVGITTVACIIGANTINLRRNAALAGLYSISERAFSEYQNKVIENIGEAKENEIRRQASSSSPIEDRGSKTKIYNARGGDQLYHDSLSGAWFRSDGQTIRKIENDLNLKIRRQMWIEWNDLYDELGLDRVLLGDSMGWNVNRPLEIIPKGESYGDTYESYTELTYRNRPFERYREV